MYKRQEEDDDPYVARVVELREQVKVDHASAFEGFSRLVEEPVSYTHLGAKQKGKNCVHWVPSCVVELGRKRS